MRVLICTLSVFFLAACGTYEKHDPGPVKYHDGNAGIDSDAVLEDMADAQRAEAASHQKDEGLGFPKGVVISPKLPTIEDSLEAIAPLPAGSDSFSEVSFVWYVNGARVSGVTRSVLKPAAGRFVSGDTVYVVARIENIEGHAAEGTSKAIEIVNAKPVMLSDVRNASGLNGLRLKAEDPDGDKLRWSVEDGPPGISIEPNGRIRVRAVDLKKAFSGEVVFVAEDPDGARAELHIPVAVNAATEGTREASEVKTVKHRQDVSEAEFEKANLDAGDRIEKMSPEEFDRYIREQERRAK